MPRIPFVVRLCLSLLLSLVIAGCSRPVLVNAPAPAHVEGPAPTAQAMQSNSVTLVLGFSGGAMRASAFSYGVMKALRGIHLSNAGQASTLLDEADVVSGVSGGAFTAAMYGLEGDGIFSTYEPAFLRRNLDMPLYWAMLSPRMPFGTTSRSQRMLEVYEKHLFHGRTFADIAARPGAPLVLVNATELGNGVRFSYSDEYFRLICSRLDTVPVSHAVTASSSVPILLTPMVLRNHDGCDARLPTRRWDGSHDPVFAQTMARLRALSDKSRSPYLHLVDGGVTDNIGLRAVTDTVELLSGPDAFMQRLGKPAADKVLFIVADATLARDNSINRRAAPPSALAAIYGITDLQTETHNAETLADTRHQAESWARHWAQQLGRPVEVYLVYLDFASSPDAAEVKALGQLPTNYHLRDTQVNLLLHASRAALLAHPEFKRFLRDMQASGTSLAID